MKIFWFAFEEVDVRGCLVAGENGAECRLGGSVVIVFIEMGSAESEAKFFGVEADSLVD